MNYQKTLLIIISTLFTIGCSKDEIILDIETIIQNDSINTTTEESTTNDVVNIFKTNPTIYNTSIENHERNSGWVTYEGNGHQIFQMEAQSAVTYVDYDMDGDLDIIYRGEPGPEWGHMKVVVNDNNTFYTLEEDIFVDYPKNREYRKLVSVDIDNDGDMDLIGFNAVDRNENPILFDGTQPHGGLDLFRFDNGKYYFEVVQEPVEGHRFFFHGGAAADVNGDGWVDVVAGTGGIIYLNDGQGNLRSDYTQLFHPDNFPSMVRKYASWFAIELIDVNNDGLTDMLVGEARGYPDLEGWEESEEEIRELYKDSKIIHFGINQPPYFEEVPYVLETEYEFKDSENYYLDVFRGVLDYSVVDFDNDGDLDIFSYSYGENGFGAIEYHENINNTEYIVNNDIFVEGDNILRHSPNWIKVVDYDGDGQLEILNEFSGGQEWNIMRKNGEGKYQRNIEIPFN